MASCRKLDAQDAEILRSLWINAASECGDKLGTSAHAEAQITESAWKERLKQNDGQSAIGAFFGDQLVGIVFLCKNTPKSYSLWGLYVVRDYRRMGIGRQLIRTAEDALPSVELTVSIAVKADSPALLIFYLSLGYLETGFSISKPSVDGQFIEYLVLNKSK